MGHDVFGGSNFGHSKGSPNALYLIFAKNISFTVPLHSMDKLF